MTKPDPIITKTDRSIFTKTPVAFRTGKWHPWRSYDAGNPRYKRDFNLHFYTTERIDGVEVLCILTVEPVGTFVETHCCECGAYTSGYLDKPIAEISWETLRMKCDVCVGKNSQPQDAARFYTPEYQASVLRAMGK